MAKKVQSRLQYRLVTQPRATSTGRCTGSYTGFKNIRDLYIHQTAQHARERTALACTWCEEKLVVTLGHGAMSALWFFSIFWLSGLDEGTWRSSGNAGADGAWLEHEELLS